MSKKCEGLVDHCRKCGRDFENYERMRFCPECGEDRSCENDTKGRFCIWHGGVNEKAGFYGKGKVPVSVEKKDRPPKYAIVGLARKYHDIKQDGQISSLRPLHTLVAGRIIELLDRLSENDTPQRMAALFEAWAEFKRTHPGVQKYYHTDSAKSAYNRMEALMEAVFHDYAAWNQILKLIDEKRKLSESEMKILKDMKALMSAEDVYEMWAKLLAAVMKVVDDPEQIRAIQYEFAKIVGDDDDLGPGEGSAEIIDLGDSGMDRGQVLYTGDVEPPRPQGKDIPPALPEGHTEGSVP